jgi:hypothetical protein
MRILILGTSNSLLKMGWVAGLREGLPSATIDNMSVGASPGIQFAQHLDIDFSAYDVVFMDSIPNDEEYREIPYFSGSLGYSSETFVDRILYEIAATIASETFLVMLGFCRSFNLRSPSSTFNSHREIATATGAQFLDIRSLLAEFGPSLVADGEDLYEPHPAHPQSKISHHFGRLLGEVITPLLSQKSSVSNRSYRENFSVWRAEDHAMQLKMFQNSLYSEKYAILTADEAIPLDFPGRCIGFNINTMATSGVVQLRGPSDDAVRISCFYRYSETGIMKIFIPIPNGRQVVEFSLSDNAENVHICGLLSEKTAQEYAPTTIAVSRIVFWNGATDVPWRDTMGAERDANLLTKIMRQRMLMTVNTLIQENIILNAIRSNLHGDNLVLFTHHGTVLTYDLARDCCAHVVFVDLTTSQTLYPVRLRLNGNSVTLFVAAYGLELVLSVRISDKTLGFVGGSNDVATTEFMGELGFSIRYNGNYLAAEPNGNIICNRPIANAWEIFEIKPIPSRLGQHLFEESKKLS